MNIGGVVQAMIQSGAFRQVANNPMAQFGTPQRKYLGAELLPEVMKQENSYVEEAIQYRTIVANDGTRYSPVQIKSGVITGSFQVTLGHQDIGSHFTGQDYDALIRILEQTTNLQGVADGAITRPDMMAMSQLTNWADVTINRPLIEKIEKQRWECIVDAQIPKTGDNGYAETIKYSNPTGHRVVAAGNWSDVSYDPYTDLMAGVEFLAGKGYRVNRIVTDTSVRGLLTLNPKILARVGHIRVDNSGNAVNQSPGRAPIDKLNSLFAGDELPPLEIYDLQYRTNTGYSKFLKSNLTSGGVLCMFCTTGRDQTIDRGDVQPLIVNNTLGYVGVGRAAGQSAPGRVIKTRHIDDSKPPRIEGEGWQSSQPVPQDPEAMFIIKGIQ